MRPHKMYIFIINANNGSKKLKKDAGMIDLKIVSSMQRKHSPINPDPGVRLSLNNQLLSVTPLSRL